MADCIDLLPSTALYPSDDLFPCDSEEETKTHGLSNIIDINRYILEDDDEVLELIANMMRAVNA